jgi:hypothetical protein
MGTTRGNASQRIAVMTLADALKIAAQAKPTRRASLDKLQRGDALVKFTAKVADLSKRYDELTGDFADIRKQLDQMRCDLDHCANSPGEKRRIIN